MVVGKVRGGGGKRSGGVEGKEGRGKRGRAGGEGQQVGGGERRG